MLEKRADDLVSPCADSDIQDKAHLLHPERIGEESPTFYFLGPLRVLKYYDRWFHPGNPSAIKCHPSPAPTLFGKESIRPLSHGGRVSPAHRQPEMGKVIRSEYSGSCDHPPPRTPRKSTEKARIRRLFPGTLHRDQRREVGDVNPTQLLEINLMALALALLLPSHSIQSLMECEG